VPGLVREQSGHLLHHDEQGGGQQQDSCYDSSDYLVSSSAAAFLLVSELRGPTAPVGPPFITSSCGEAAPDVFSREELPVAAQPRVLRAVSPPFSGSISAYPGEFPQFVRTPWFLAAKVGTVTAGSALRGGGFVGRRRDHSGHYSRIFPKSGGFHARFSQRVAPPGHPEIHKSGSGLRPETEAGCQR
jgi:hypothetical protein